MDQPPSNPPQTGVPPDPELDPTLTAPSPTGTGDTLDATRADGSLERILAGAHPPFLERYPIGATLGRGGMAEVFRAEDRVLHRMVAVKLMHGAGRTEAKLRRFLREAQITAQLAHPNVVPVYAVENSGDGEPALVMKCIDGQTMKEFLAECRTAAGTADWRHERHGLNARLEILLKVCEAVAFAHSRGVVHLDLKPANVMIGTFGEVYVMDWGIARIVHQPVPADTKGESGAEASRGVVDTSGLVTGAGGVLGTPLYMPPEQMGDRAEGAGPAADQFALGMMLYELLTMELPRPAEPVDKVLEYALQGRRLPFRKGQGSPSVPRPLQAATDRATARDPAQRYPSVPELATDLRRYLHGEELAAFPDDLPRKVWRRVQKHPVKALAGVLVLVLVAATTSILSLEHALSSSRRHEQEVRTLAQLVARISAFAHTHDQMAKDVERLVESLAVEAESALARGGDQAVGSGFLAPAEIANHPDAAFHERYRQVVTFSAPVTVFAPGHDRAMAAAQLRPFADFAGVFRDQFLRGQKDAPESPSEAEMDATLRSGDWMAYAYIGFTSGSMLSFPGNENWPPDYDPRERGWYQGAPEGREVGWGDPYNDASGSGFLVPCNRRIRDPEGRFVGVVGIDAHLDFLIETLRVPNIEHQRDTVLADTRGMVVATKDDLGRSWGVGTFGDGEKGREPLKDPELRRELLKGQRIGVLRAPDSIFVYARLDAVGWYLVVELDRQAVLGS